MPIRFFFNKPEKEEREPTLRNRGDFDSYASYIFANARFADLTVKEVADDVKSKAGLRAIVDLVRSVSGDSKEEMVAYMRGQSPQYWLNENLFYRLCCILWLDRNGYGDIHLDLPE